MNFSRRRLLTGLATLIAAPTIVRATSIMAVRPLLTEPLIEGVRYVWIDGIRLDYFENRIPNISFEYVRPQRIVRLDGKIVLQGLRRAA